MKARVVGWLLACGTAFFAAHVANAAQTGSVVVWGNQVLPVVQPGTRYIALAGGSAHNVALKSDGNLVAWGHDRYGQCRVPAGATNVVAVAAGGYHNLALMAGKSVVAWGAG